MPGTYICPIPGAEDHHPDQELYSGDSSGLWTDNDDDRDESQDFAEDDDGTDDEPDS